MTFAPISGPCPVCHAEHVPLKPADANDSAVYQKIANNFAQDEIADLREQVEKLTKERDELLGAQVLNRNALRLNDEKLVSLAEQVEKFRKLLPYCNTGHYGYSIQQMYFEAAQLPDLASPVLNRIRADGMREAINLYSPDDSAQDWIDKIGARADELEKTNG